MTSVDNHSWLSLQTYVIDDWAKIAIYGLPTKVRGMVVLEVTVWVFFKVL
jgi:hypothetical protein